MSFQQFVGLSYEQEIPDFTTLLNFKTGQKQTNELDIQQHSGTDRVEREEIFWIPRGHIGVDVGSKLIGKRSFTPAKVHDSTEMETVLSGDERSIYYGVLVKG